MNTTHLSAKKVLIALIVGLLSSFVVFSQSSDMQWTMHVDNLNVGGTGKITIKGENKTDNAITISKINLPSFLGIEILRSPDPVISINGNAPVGGDFATTKQYIPYEAIQPHSSIEMTYSVAATCEAIYEAGDSVTVLEKGTIVYSDGMEERLDRASFSVSYPRLQLLETRKIIGEENQMEMILKIVNLMQDVPAQGVRFNINFTDDARPLPQEMYANISIDGTHWSNSIWTGNTYSNPSEFDFTNAELRNIGMESLRYGDTLYVKYALQLNTSATTIPLEYEMLFPDAMGNYCSNKAEQGTISILRQTGTPNLTVSQKDIEPFDFCGAKNGRMAVVIKNIGDGVAYINSINLGNVSVIPQSAKIAGVNVLGTSGYVSMPTTNIDGDGGLEDVNRDDTYSELAAGDSITIDVEYALSSNYNMGTNSTYTLSQTVEYVSSNNEMLKTAKASLSGGVFVSNFEFTGADIVDLERSNIYEYNLNIQTTVLRQLMYSDYICYFSVRASEGITINGGSNVYQGTFTNGNFNETLQLEFDENAFFCQDSYINISYGVKNEECGRMKAFGNISKVISVEKNIQLDTNANDIILTDFSAYRTNYGWKLSDVNNIIPYKSNLEQIQKITRDESTTSNVVSDGDTVQLTLIGEYNIVDNTNDYISATISMSNTSPSLKFFKGIYQVGSIQGPLTIEAKPYSNDFYFKIPIENVERFHDSIRIDVWCVVEYLLSNKDISQLSAYFQMEKSGETAEMPCPMKQDIIGYRRNVNKTSSSMFCGSTLRLYTTNVYDGEYNPNLQVSKITIFREGGLSLDKDKLSVFFQNPRMDVDFSLYEYSDKYELRFEDTLLLDVSTTSRNLFVSIQALYSSYETSSKNVPIYIEGLSLYNIKLSDNPVFNVSRPEVVSTQKKTVSWNVIVSGNSAKKNLYFKWKSDQMRLIDVRNSNDEVLAENDSDEDSIIFEIPAVDGTTIMTFTAEIQDCANGDTLHSLLQTAISCNEIDETEFDIFIAEGYNRNLDATVNSIALPVTKPAFETRYVNLCDTVYYSFQISNIGADTSNVSFWMDNISENVDVKNVNATIGSETYQLGNYNTPSNRNITADAFRNSSTDNIDEAYTVVNVGLAVECDPTKDYIDVTKPINAHVLRYDICNNPVEEVFRIQPKIKGFENMDSIRFTATAVNFDSQGIGTVSVSLQNKDLQLIDSVDFTALLPDGIEYVENSTTPNYFSSIQRKGQSVVWAFERNKHVDGNENLQFTFQVRNANRCEQGDFTLKMATSLERTLHGSCGLDCLVKKTSDTVQLEMQQTPVPLLESFSVDKQTICAGDELTTTIVTNGDNVSTTISANPTEGIVIDNNRITVESSVNGIINLVVLANDGQCKESDTLTVEVLSKEQATILSSTEQVLVGNSHELMATPANGVWLSEYVDENGVFKSEKSGVYTVYYEIDNGVCNSKDSIEIPVYSCEKDLFIEPDSLKVSEQAYQIIVPISLSPVAQCGICSDLTTLKFNVIFNDEYLEYDRIELQQILQETVDIYNRVDKNTIVIQMYSDAINGFVMDSINLLKIYFNVKQPTNTSISISEGYYNGELSSEILREDSIQIYYMPKLTVTMNDTLFCAGGQVELVPIVENPSNGELRYQWNNRQNTPTIIVSRAGDYVVTVYDSFGSYDSKHVVVSEAPAIVAELADTAFCEGTTITIQPNITQGEISQYEWNTGENTAAVSVSSAGTYTVTMTDIYGCTSDVSANVIVNENSEIPVFTYNRNNMDSYTATISNAVENNVYMWHGSEGVTFDSNQSPSVTISVASYPAAICVDSKDVNGCTSVSHCDTIPQTPPISILGNNVLCLQNMGFEWLRQEFQIESPSSGSNYVWSLSDNSMAELNPVSNGIEVRPFGIQGDVDLIVQEFRNGELVNEGRKTLQIRVRPQYTFFEISGPHDWNSLCPNTTDVHYFITQEGEYHWTVYNGAQITSGQGTNHVTIDVGEIGTSIEVRPQNGEGCVGDNPITTWVGTGAENCVSLKSFTIEDVESQPNEIQLEPNTEGLNVAIYPVPVANVLNIVANANIENVIIYTSSGSEVKTVAKQNQIDVSSLLSGDYFVRIVTDKGVVTKSIIVVK